MRYQGGLRHYHVAPPRPKVSREQWIGLGSSHQRKKFWYGVGLAVALASLGGIVLGLIIELSA